MLKLVGCVTHHQVNSVSAREQLAQSIRDLTAALAERHASLTQALEAARQKRGEALAAQVAERRSLMEHAGLMAFTQELLKETDQPCFVQASRQTHNRFFHLFITGITLASFWASRPEISPVCRCLFISYIVRRGFAHASSFCRKQNKLEIEKFNIFVSCKFIVSSQRMLDDDILYLYYCQ